MWTCPKPVATYVSCIGDCVRVIRDHVALCVPDFDELRFVECGCCGNRPVSHGADSVGSGRLFFRDTCQFPIKNLDRLSQLRVGDDEIDFGAGHH